MSLFKSGLYCSLLLLVSASFIPKLSAQITLGGGAAGTVIMQGWAQHNIEPLVKLGQSRGSNSGQNKEPGQYETRHDKPSEFGQPVPRDLIGSKPDDFSTSTRQDKLSFSVSCPPNWNALNWPEDDDANIIPAKIQQ